MHLSEKAAIFMGQFKVKLVKEKMGRGRKERGGGGVNKGRDSVRQLMRREERRLSRVSDERARKASSINDDLNG